MADRSTVSARRYETYVRWTVYITAVAPIISLVGGALATRGAVMAEDLTRLTVASVLTTTLAAGSVLVSRWGLSVLAGHPSRLPAGVVVAWLLALAGLVVVALAVPTGETRLTAVAAVGSVTASLVPVLDVRRTLYLNAAILVAAAPLAAFGDLWLLLRDVTLVSVYLWSCWFGTWTLRVLHELRQAHEDRAALTLANERLRISRDVHDVFGRTLTAIAVKSELASELVRRGNAVRAAAELDDVRKLAQEAETVVRRVVRGEARVTWDGEVAGACSLLGSAGIRCTVSGDPVPEECAEGLAWVVREGMTNVLRHSAATRVTLATANQDGQVRLTIANDGAGRVRPVPAPGTALDGPRGTNRDGGTAPDGPHAANRDGGTGLRAMSERIRELGGHIATRRDGDWFLLDATVPLPERGRG
ncbi:sensor histidine kinase [[Actinomadura] parvosata]|uniref:sensor histidine kinase n=1 Tax=[Actinomadura] parvosata TaxID=1955412 RepID=UPI00406C6C5F